MHAGQEVTLLRPLAAERFLATLEAAFAAAELSPPARACVDGVFVAAKEPAPWVLYAGEDLAVLRWLGPVLRDLQGREGALADLGQALAALLPDLRWSTRKLVGPTASDGFASAHANAVVLGPGGLEPREDIWVGISLMAPGTRYPDHTHPPEEVYLVLSEGAFYQAGAGWVAKAPGDTVYNPPGIVHAMRSGDAPFLAIWCLRA